MLIDKLNKFTDIELAYLCKFQIKGYLKETQEEIKNYIFNTRALTLDNLKELIKKNDGKSIESGKDICPRCKTDKLSNDKSTCNVCGFILSAPNNESPNEWGDLFDLLDF